MKKIILLSTLWLAACILVQAQPSHGQKERLFFASISGGPAFPISDFASNDLAGNSQAGFAKTGFSLNLQAGYQFDQNLGVTAQFMYSMHGLQLGDYAALGIQADHWQYYGLAVGPRLVMPISDKFKLDLKALGGIARVNSPQVSYLATPILEQQWVNSFIMNVGMDLRYLLNDRLYLVAGADFYNIKPNFHLVNAEGTATATATQKINDMPVSIGIGIAF